MNLQIGTYNGEEWILVPRKKSCSQYTKTRLSDGASHLSDAIGFTNIRTMKLVPEDAVVIEAKDVEELNAEVNKLILAPTYGDWHETPSQAIFRILHPLLTPPTPPMEEPKEFGAMVEADYRSVSGAGLLVGRRKWIRLADSWNDNTGLSVRWQYLINPTPYKKEGA